MKENVQQSNVADLSGDVTRASGQVIAHRLQIIAVAQRLGRRSRRLATSGRVLAGAFVTGFLLERVLRRRLRQGPGDWNALQTAGKAAILALSWMARHPPDRLREGEQSPRESERIPS